MPYFIRVLSPSSDPVTASALQNGLKSAGLHAQLSADDGDADWSQLSVSRASGEELFIVERDEVSTESVGREELDEFLEEIVDALPTSGADWLKAYLPTVRTIYSFQILGSVRDADSWSIVSCVKGTIWRQARGIIQADSEGFTNEDGYHILWKFSEHVTGGWWMAVRDHDSWRTFQMDPGNRAHREAFMRGEVPEGVSSTS